jgi:hypothetical protein
VFRSNSTSTLEAGDQCLRVKWSQKSEGRTEMRFQRTGGKGFKVLLRQGLKDKTLGERGSLRCCKSKASCSLLLPDKRLAQMKHKIKTRELKEGECCCDKVLSSNPKEKTTLGVDNLGLGCLPLLDSKGTTSARERETRSVATARLSSSLSMAKGFSIRGHETRTYLCACHLGFLFSKL